MLTPEELVKVHINTKVWDLVQNKFIWACTCRRGGRAHVSYIRSHPAEFSMKEPKNELQ